MSVYRPPRIPFSELTPKDVYLSRRGFIAATAMAGLAVAGGPAIAAPLTAAPGRFKLDEKLTPKEAVTTYNNFYEFGVNKEDPSQNAGAFKPTPWTVKVEGMVGKPKEFGLDELMKMTLEERTYRMRCVEGWSMVIPWIGFPLSAVLDQVDPLGSAKYVAFETVVRPEEMPGQAGLFQPLPWPYIEGLRLDEARHPLTILAVGLYGETLPNQNGAPIRLVVPWKYGFKSIKRLLRHQTGGYAALQRLWQRSCRPLCGHGPQGELLIMAPLSAVIPALPRRYHAASIWAVYVIGLCPAAWYFVQAATGGLGFNPVKTFEHLLGIWALRFIIATLAITPLRDLAGINWIRYRRALGLIAFYYVTMHFAVYLLLDLQLNFAAVGGDIAKRPYITIGFAALVLLIPLAVTSNSWSIRKLGQIWVKLHKLIYLIAAGGAFHYVLAVKSVTLAPFIHVALICLLLGYRVARKPILNWKRGRRQPA
eukprot:g20000.t1